MKLLSEKNHPPELVKNTADHLSPERRSELMARVKGKDTIPEKKVRSWLHRNGYRFRLYRKDLPGSPDIVMSKYRMVIFVHGCFWHRHQGCRKTTTPKTRVDFWETKFTQNIERDARVQEKLKSLGWRVVVVWQCETEKPDVLDETMRKRLRML